MRLGLLHNVDVGGAVSDSVSPGDSPDDSELNGKAEGWFWGRDPVDFAILGLEYSLGMWAGIYPKSLLVFGSDAEM